MPSGHGQEWCISHVLGCLAPIPSPHPTESCVLLGTSPPPTPAPIQNAGQEEAGEDVRHAGC